MAEAVVGLLIRKLGETLLNEAATYGASLLCTEASSLKGLFNEIRKAASWLEIMKAYLQDVEKLRETNNTTAAFVNKIRGLAFRMEDVVDEFNYTLEEQKLGGFAAKMKKRIQHVKVWRRLALKLHGINADLEEAAKQRNLCAMPEMVRYGGGNNLHAGSINNPTSYFAREEDLVGIKENTYKLKGWLLDCLEEMKSRIITVWGMGGVGKTTLVDHVYKTVKKEFDLAARVTVSKSYQVEDLLKKIAQKLDISEDISNMERGDLDEVISNHLKGKRYIIVLDDVWEKDVWIDIMDIFPNNCISRFIFTSRNLEVASMATENCVIKLEPLRPHYSSTLFCNLAFRNAEDKSCPSELANLAIKFLEKCDGLPLAIACIGRLLSCKAPTLAQWTKVYEELEFQSRKHVIRGVDSIIKLSMENLSCELKNCFLHCALFPEDYGIKRRRLIRHWITSGFIREEENKTLEDVAEGYLNELVNRSLLQITLNNEFGRVKCCRMHDIIRHVALHKAEEEFFGKVYEASGSSKAGVRRLSIQSFNVSSLSHSHGTYTRAILSFTRIVDIDLLRPVLASSRLLSMLDLQGTQVKVLPSEVFSLFNLKFLGIRQTGINILPDAVKRLQNLEVLDALFTGLVSLPEGVAKLKKLRYLYASTKDTERTMGIYGGVKLPRGTVNLTGLHALQEIKASLETLIDLVALTELRTFAVTGVTGEHSSNLCAAIMNMKHLVHLRISASDENEILPFESLSLPKTLYKLSLTGQLEKKRMPQILSSWSHLSKLTNLFLRRSKLDEDSFSRLMVLHSLHELVMTKAYDGNELHFPALSFPKLRKLCIYGAPQLNQFEIEEGALESLVEFRLSGCPELKCLPSGIKFITSLEVLLLWDTSEELTEKLRQKLGADGWNEELMKIRHIRKVGVLIKKEENSEWIRPMKA